MHSKMPASSSVSASAGAFLYFLSHRDAVFFPGVFGKSGLFVKPDRPGEGQGGALRANLRISLHASVTGGLGIGAKCIENGMSPWIDANMENAALELADEAVEGVGRAALRMTQLAGEILTGIAIPQDVSLGGGGGSHNDLPKKKDDEWNRFKPAFGMRPNGRGRRR